MILNSPQTSYEPTKTDRLWLLRAVQAEGEPRPDVARALVARFMVLRERDPNMYPTLTDFVQAYSQPVNPKHMRGGKLWQPLYDEAEAAGDDDARAKLEEADARRRRHRAVTQFDSKTEKAVLLALEHPQEPAKYTDFAAAGKSRAKHLNLIREGVPRVSNDLFRLKGLAADWGLWIGDAAPADAPPADADHDQGEPKNQPPRVLLVAALFLIGKALIDMMED